MKKTIALILVLCTICSLCISFTSCGNKSKEITINYGGGQGDNNLVVDKNTEFEDFVRSIPTKEGYVFAGWYSDAMYTDYIDPYRISKTQLKNGTAFAKFILVPESVNYNVRTDTITITDSGRKNQKMDIVQISEDYSVKDLIRAGYKSLKITLTASVCEVDDGYQYIFLYSDTNCADNDVSSLMDIYDKYVFGNDSEDPSLLYAHKFDHGVDKVDTSWGNISFTINIDLIKLKDDLYIRYGASGKNDDDWRNKDIFVTVQPIK